MPVNQVIRWQASDGKEFDQEEDAIDHEAYLMRREDLEQVIDPVWSYDPDKRKVIAALLDNFIFTRKD